VLPVLQADAERMAVAMPQQMIGIVIDQVVDENLRVRLALVRIETLAELSLADMEVTPDEIDVFIQMDARVWFWAKGVAGDRVH
jgi:hypothetical protein